MRALINKIPSPEQLTILTDDRPGFRLIRGAAGSGKTTAALLRLSQLCGSRLNRRYRLGAEGPVRVLVLTFNKTLRGYVWKLAQEKVQESDALDLKVDTFGHWALNLVGQRQVLSGQAWRNEVLVFLLRAGISEHNAEYFIDEVEYVIGRFLPDRRDEYLDVRRSGRGGAPAVPRRIRQRLMNDVIEPFEKWKGQRGISDWNDIAVEAVAVRGEAYDVVVVDESQDLSANQIRAILAHLNEHHATTFIMDTVQRIYPRGFLWREVGIDMRPQMVFPLARNHRNTAEIARFAASLVRDMPIEDDGLLPDESACERSGVFPQVVVGTYAEQLNFMLDRIRPSLESEETVAILQPRGGNWFRYAKQALKERGIDYCELTRQRNWPTGPELVALSTIHSAKGLEFDHVLLPGLSREVMPHGDEAGDGRLESLRRLVTMGIGRARRSVMVGYKPGEESPLIQLFDPSTFQLVRI